MKVAPATTRITLIDVLRGYFLFAIVVNHTRLFPSLFVFFTGGTKLWVSFAEGFFLISGFILAYLFREKNVSCLGIFKKTWSRMLKIYTWSVFLTLVITLISNLIPQGTAKGGLWIVSGENIINLIGDSLIYKYIYGYADFLPYYAVFLLFSPFIFVLLRKFGYVFVFLTSILMWFFRGSNVYLAQQIMFVLGILLGDNFITIKNWYLLLRVRTTTIVKKSIIFLFLFTLGLSIISTFFIEDLLSLLVWLGAIPETIQDLVLKKNNVLNLLFDKNTLGVGRLVLAPIWLGSILILFVKYEDRIRSVFGGIFERWGRNSLFIFIVHALLVIPVPIIMKYFPGNFFTNTIVSFLVLFLIDLLVKLKLRYLPRKTVFD